jgi:hypothetical protein
VGFEGCAFHRGGAVRRRRGKSDGRQRPGGAIGPNGGENADPHVVTRRGFQGLRANAGYGQHNVAANEYRVIARRRRLFSTVAEASMPRIQCRFEILRSATTRGRTACHLKPEERRMAERMGFEPMIRL